MNLAFLITNDQLFDSDHKYDFREESRRLTKTTNDEIDKSPCLYMAKTAFECARIPFGIQSIADLKALVTGKHGPTPDYVYNAPQLFEADYAHYITQQLFYLASKPIYSLVLPIMTFAALLSVPFVYIPIEEHCADERENQRITDEWDREWKQMLEDDAENQ